jgi:hypothetical protein
VNPLVVHLAYTPSFTPVAHLRVDRRSPKSHHSRGLKHNSHRPHRGINQRAPNDTADVVAIGPGHPIERHTVCGGPINEYRTAARTTDLGHHMSTRETSFNAPPPNTESTEPA